MDIGQNYLKLAEAIAKKYAGNWGFYENKVTNWEDILSELKIWIYSNIENLERWETETRIINYKRFIENKELIGDGRPYVSMRNAANKICGKELEHMIHSELDRRNYYTPEKVMAALPVVLQENFYELEMNSTSDSLAYNIAYDIYYAFWSLTEEDREYLFLRFKDDLSFASMGEELGKKENTVTVATHRAVDRLVSKLGGEPLAWVKPEKRMQYPKEML